MLSNSLAAVLLSVMSQNRVRASRERVGRRPAPSWGGAGWVRPRVLRLRCRVPGHAPRFVASHHGMLALLCRLTDPSTSCIRLHATCLVCPIHRFEFAFKPPLRLNHNALPTGIG